MKTKNVFSGYKYTTKEKDTYLKMYTFFDLNYLFLNEE